MHSDIVQTLKALCVLCVELGIISNFIMSDDVYMERVILFVSPSCTQEFKVVCAKKMFLH